MNIEFEEDMLSNHKPLLSVLRSFDEVFSKPSGPTEPELRQNLELVASLGSGVLEELLSIFPNLPQGLHRIATYCLACLGQERVLPGLLDLVRDKRIEDESRWELIQAMVDLGFDLSSEDLSVYFDEFEDCTDSIQDVCEMVDSIAGSPQAMGHWLSQLENMRIDVRQSLVEDLGRAGSTAVPILEVLLENGDPALFSPIVKALAGTESPHALPLLRRARRQAPDLKQAQLAYQAEHEMSGRELTASDALVTWPEPSDPHRSAVVTFLDASGSRSLVFTSTPAQGPALLDSLYVLSHVNEGIRDCVGQESITPEEHEATLPTLTGPLGGGHVPADYALNLLCDAMYRNSLLGEPIAYPFGIWRRQILPGLDLEPLPFEPELSEVTPTVDILDEPEVLEGTRELLQHPPYDSWFLDVPELFNLIDPDLPASMRNTPAGVQDLAIRQIILPNLSTYLRSLDLNADLLARLGLPDLARQTMIVRTALATADREVIAATGFVQGLIQQTLDRLHEANLEKYAIPPSTNLH